MKQLRLAVVLLALVPTACTVEQPIPLEEETEFAELEAPLPDEVRWRGVPMALAPVGLSYEDPGDALYEREEMQALAEAFTFQEQIGRDAIAARIHQLNRQLKEGLASMPHVRLFTPMSDALSAGITTFMVDGMTAKQVEAALHGVEASPPVAVDAGDVVRGQVVELAPVRAAVMAAEDSLARGEEVLVGQARSLVHGDRHGGTPVRRADHALVGGDGAIFGGPDDVGVVAAHELADLREARGPRFGRHRVLHLGVLVAAHRRERAIRPIDVLTPDVVHRIGRAVRGLK